MNNADPVFGLFETISAGVSEAFHNSNFLLIAIVPLSVLLALLLIWYISIRIKRHRDLESFEEETIPTPDEELPATVVPGNTTPAYLETQLEITSIKTGLAKTRKLLADSINKIFTGQIKVDNQILEKLHETLYKSDIGIQTVDHLIKDLQKKLSSNESSNFDEVKKYLRQSMLELLTIDQTAKFFTGKPKVILVVGVNGVGKTTTIAKLASYYITNNLEVLLCAADTYRAAAIEQLKIWGDRVGAKVIAQSQGSDPAAVAFDAMKSAIARESDLLLIDTAGRLHNKSELMSELSKMKKVLAREMDQAPHEIWLVVDATTGQNALQQVKAFTEAVQLTGVIVTKIDGTAKGGVLLGVAHQYKLPIKFVGVGESMADLKPFDAREYVESII